MSKINEMEWLVEAKGDLGRSEQSYETSPCIFSASRTLLNECEEAYVPQIVSIGPYHFGKPQLSGMERYKGDAARRQLFRIQSNAAISACTFNHVVDEIENFKEEVDAIAAFKEVVDKIATMEPKIRRCYDKEIPYTGEVLCWMMARDACFILEFFRNYFWEFVVDDKIFENDEDFQFLQRFHPIFGPKSENPVVKCDIVKDLIKLENQIPLFVLTEVLAMEMMGSQESAISKLQKFLKVVFSNIYYRPFSYYALGRESSTHKHILDMYHCSCVGDVVRTPTEKRAKEDAVPVQAGKEHCISVGDAGKGPNNFKDSISLEEYEELEGNKLKLPSAVELKNAGVNIQASNGTIHDIKFEDRTLSIVPIKLHVDSEIFIRNLIALEVCSPDYKVKIMTAYTQFMDELCQRERGVGVMREQGVIVGNLWHHSRVTQLLSSSSRAISLPECHSIEKTRKKLRKYYGRKCRITGAILWTEFWKAYMSKPWLVIGGIGASIVLLLTAIQVICLFRDCGRKA